MDVGPAVGSGQQLGLVSGWVWSAVGSGQQLGLVSSCG